MIEEVIIPELEEIAASYIPRGTWTDRQHAILDRYYGRVPISRLRDVVGHSIDAIHREAARRGLKKISG